MAATASNCSPDFPDSLGKAAQLPDDPVKSQINDAKLIPRTRKRVSGPAGMHAPLCNSSACSSSSTVSAQSFSRGLRIAKRQRSPRVFVRQRASDVDSMAFPLGVSIAAVVAQVLERTDATYEKMPADYLSKICTTAVRESLANVFGNKFELFARNFEKSFESTLNTLILVKDSSREHLQDHLCYISSKDNCSEMTPAMHIDKVECSSRNTDANNCQGESTLPSVFTAERSSYIEDIQQNQLKVCMTRELSLHNAEHLQLSCVSSNLSSLNSGSMLSIYEKSIAEQVRSNDLKAFEIGLAMKKLQLKEAQLSLNSDSNFLERCKLSMGVSKASFKAEKFKTEMEDTRHAELLRNCIDCLVAGLLIMSSLIAYGAYIFSYKRITEATSSCTPSTESNNSWWIPKPMSSFSSGLQTLRCQVQVISRMLFGLLMILSIAYLMVQRSAAPRQSMPLTFILLLLGFGCGIVGKFCIDTLGGSGYHWLMYWEVLCALHFFANMFTPLFFLMLYGPIKACQVTKQSVIFPYWIRRVLFYLVTLLILPLLSGLLPFASLGEWKNHFSALISNLLLVAREED